MYLPRGRQQRRRGTTIVEMAFVGLIVFTMMFAIFEFGRVMMAVQVVNSAGRTAARQAVVTATSYIDPATATTTIQQVATNGLQGQLLTNVNIQIYQADSSGNNIGAWTSAPFGQDIVVQIDADLPLIFPTFGFLPSTGAATNSLHLTTRCMMRGEAN